MSYLSMNSCMDTRNTYYALFGIMIPLSDHNVVVCRMRSIVLYIVI